MLHLREDERAAAAHLLRVTRHHVEVRADPGSKIRFVDDEQVGLRDAGAALARNLVAATHVNDLDGVVGQFATVAGGEIIASGFDEQNVRLELAVQIFERKQVGRNILANRRVRTAARLDRANALRFQRAILHEEFAVLFREDVVRDRADAHALAQLLAELEHQRRLAAAHRAAHADGERAPTEVARQGLLALVKLSGPATSVMMSSVQQ